MTITPAAARSQACARRSAVATTIGVVLVDRSGRILAREHGGFDDQKATRLAAALERSNDGA
jgi:hypothetical protein